MKKIYYLIVSLIIFINFSGCSGYKPIYNTSNFNFKIEDYSIGGNEKIGNQIYLNLYNLAKSNKNNQSAKKINISINSNRNKSATAKSSTGKIIEYKINLNADITIIDFLTGKTIISHSFNFFSSYKAQDRYSETIKLENKNLEDLINKLNRDLLIKISGAISEQ